MDVYLAELYGSAGVEKTAEGVSPWGYSWADLEEAALEKIAETMALALRPGTSIQAPRSYSRRAPPSQLRVEQLPPDLPRPPSSTLPSPQQAKVQSQPLRRVGRGLSGRKAALIAGAGLAVGGLGYGAYRVLGNKKQKKSADSAFEQLVEQRAYEHLDAAGFLEKEATGEDFETTVDRTALELLEANGYAVEWY